MQYVFNKKIGSIFAQPRRQPVGMFAERASCPTLSNALRFQGYGLRFLKVLNHRTSKVTRGGHQVSDWSLDESHTEDHPESKLALNEKEFLGWRGLSSPGDLRK